ncbi:MAG TPA: sigma-70 family RNA polymerase sigma factor [Candidatus Polarisedimenticolaceae bacterium]|nr:sigma-70 family RNA polymerase sigma factor [Candidatus Polarisedimenticolaceae bacterium]
MGRGMLRRMRDEAPPAPPSTDDEPATIRRAQAGDRRAFDRLVSTHLPQVWATVYRMLRHREDTEDVVQEVFVTAHRSIASFRGDAKLSTWLHRIAVTRALNHLDRAEERLRRASDPVDDEPAAAAFRIERGPLHALEAKELMRLLAACFEKLPAAFRAVLALRDAEEKSYEEIAAVLDIELGTVRSRLARARGSLKDCIEGGSA